MLVLSAASFTPDETWYAQLAQWRTTQFEYTGVWLPEVNLVFEPNLSPNSIKILIHQELVLSFSLTELEGLIDAGSHPWPALEIVACIRGRYLQRALNLESHLPSGLSLPMFRQREAILYCLTHLINGHLAEFIGVQETCYLMNAMEIPYGELVKELQRQLPIGKIVEVLQRLVKEMVSIRDLRSVFEALVEWAPKEKDPIMLTEYVRIALRRHIVAALRKGEPRLTVWTIGESIENNVRESIRQTAFGTYAALDTESRMTIIEQLQRGTRNEDRLNSALLTAIDIRRFISKLIEDELPGLAVLSQQEVSGESELYVAGHIDLAIN